MILIKIRIIILKRIPLSEDVQSIIWFNWWSFIELLSRALLDAAGEVFVDS